MDPFRMFGNIIVVKCPHCGTMNSHGGAKRPKENDETSRMCSNCAPRQYQIYQDEKKTWQARVPE